MRRLLAGICIGCVVVASVVGGAFLGSSSEAAEEPIEIGILVSPSNIALDSEGEWVTVHADIRYAVVVGSTVTLNGIPAKRTKPDTRGDLVAKFTLESIKGIVQPPSATLTLEGTTRDGVDFYGTDTVRVTDCKSK